MRASNLALIVTVLASSSAAYSQDSGQLDGRVGPDLNTSPMQPNPSLGSIGPYHRPPEPGPAQAIQALSCPARSCQAMCSSTQDRTAAAAPSSMATARDRWPELKSDCTGGPLR
jgi:hypothetical protein